MHLFVRSEAFKVTEVDKIFSGRVSWLKITGMWTTFVPIMILSHPNTKKPPYLWLEFSVSQWSARGWAISLFVLVLSSAETETYILADVSGVKRDLNRLLH
jgi:hypothetical protein